MHHTRSQMAAALLSKYGGDIYEAYGAGIVAKEIYPLTRWVMAEISIDTSKQYSKALKDYVGKIHFGYLIKVFNEADQNCPTTFPRMGQSLQWNFEDPDKFVGSDEEKRNKFHEIRDQIKKRVENWVDNQGNSKPS
jgi:arsenate reductase (thioredoxin)